MSSDKMFLPGMALAGVLSWITYHNVGLLIFHLIFNWFFVIYWILGFFGILPLHSERIHG